MSESRTPLEDTGHNIIKPNPNLKVIVRHDADFDVLDVKTYPDNNIQVLHEPAANSTSIAEAAI